MRAAVIVPLVAIASSGCLATKGDIRLIQDEVRATRAQVGAVDTSVGRSSQQIRQQIIALSAQIDRVNDSLRVLTAHFTAFQGTANGELNTMNGQIVQMQALLGQTTRNVQEARAQISALREQAAAPVVVPPAPGRADSANRAPPGVPGVATLFTTGKDLLDNGAYATARSTLNQLLTSYPTAAEAPRAQFLVGEAYRAEGNSDAADSVYQLLETKYPKSPEAVTGLYRHGVFLWQHDKKAEGRSVLNRVINEFPNSDEARLAKEFLRERDR